MTISKKEVIEFFDSWAGSWDEHMITDEEIIGKILDSAEVSEGKKILDVACGTGVLIPFYLERNVRSVTGIDISPKMIEIARDKFAQPNVDIICADASLYPYKEKYDCIMIYNAFPHFDDTEKLIRHLSDHLEEGGTLTVAHSMSRERINAHHDNVCHVSKPLPDIREMKKLFSTALKTERTVSDQKMYLITGKI